MRVILLLSVLTKMAMAYKSRGIEDFICFGKPTDALIPNPEECDSFFMCDGGVATKNTCPEGILFNPTSQQCDPDYKNCNVQSGAEATTHSPLITNRPTEGMGTYPFPTESPGGAITTVLYPAAPSDNTAKTCPSADTPHLTFLPSNENCDQFYLCYYGKPILFDCSGGYYWSQEKKGCVPPKQSNCKIPSPNSPFNPRCPTQGQLFYPHPRDCENFYYCENGIKSVQRCQAFYHWDVQEKKCVLKTRAICIKSIPMPMRRSFYN